MALKKKWVIAIIVSVSVVAVLAAVLTTLLVLKPWSSAVSYRRAAVASNGYECASIGREILEMGGSAADATVAVMFCESVSCAQCMGLGGGFLATVYDPTTNNAYVLNARERAPAATTLDMFDNASSTIGGLATAVPGELRGYGELHRRFGRLPWSQLVRPTAELCRRGHRVTEYMGRVLASYSSTIKEQPSLSEVYVNPVTGEVYQEGDYIQLHTYANTLDIIAEEGPEALNNGTLTIPFLRDMQSFGSIITEEDLINFRVEWQEPITARVGDTHTLYANPLPGSGAVLALILNIVSDWAGSPSAETAQANLYWHRIVEAFKYAYASRSNLGDATRTDLTYNLTEYQQHLADPALGEAYRLSIDDTRTFNDWQHYGAQYDTVEDHGTAHCSVIDADGMAVSATSTINYIWGNLRRSQSTGILLNNEMDDFAIPNRESVYGMPPSLANMLAPGLQPLSSMVPSIVVSDDGSVDLIVGGAGGTRITTQLALTILSVMVEGEDLSTVLSKPRLHHQLTPMEVQHEIDFSPEVLASLAARGHVLAQQGVAGFAAVVGVARDSRGRLQPATDPRRVGSTDGY